MHGYRSNIHTMIESSSDQNLMQQYNITGKTHQDRKLITGDNPFASNNVGKASARALLKEVGLR